jgi:hypothetical protein
VKSDRIEIQVNPWILSPDRRDPKPEKSGLDPEMWGR